MNTTSDYTIFKDMTGNRTINPTHVEALATAIERKNLLPYYPILANEQMEIIDGQHRLMAAAKLQLPVFYEIIDGLTLDDVMSINTASRNWTVYDFIDAYIRVGKTDYEILRNFIERHAIGATAAAGLLMGYSSFMGGGSLTRSLKAGTFKVFSEHYAEEIMATIAKLQPYTDFKIKTNRKFMRTLMMLRNNKNFDLERLVSKLQLSGQRITARGTVQYYLLEIEELYNFNAKAKAELYVSSQQDLKKMAV